MSKEIKYHITTAEDMELVVASRLQRLRIVNELGEDYRFTEEFVEATRKFFSEGDQTTVLAMTGETVIGCATMCYINILPTLTHPTGGQGHLMNVYTMKEWRRQGIAHEMVSILIEDAWNRGITQLTLTATQDGRPLYEKLGFADSKKYMVLVKDTDASMHEMDEQSHAK